MQQTHLTRLTSPSGLGMEIVTSTSRIRKARRREAQQAGGWCSCEEERGRQNQVPGDWEGNTTSGHAQASPKAPSRWVQAWLHSCCREFVKKPIHPSSPAWSGAQTPMLSANPANVLLHRFENHHSDPAPMPDKKNPAVDGTLPVGRAWQPTGDPPSIYTLARILRSSEPSSQQPLPTGDIPVLEPL